MKISENIRYIESVSEKWELFKNRSYTAKIQKSDSERIYNVPGRNGVVYNFLEDSYEKVSDGGYVVTGILGEMWPIGSGALRKYKIDPADITADAQEVSTVELDTVYAAIRIPADVIFTLETDYGEKAELKGNRPGIDHGDGDYILVMAKLSDGKYVPDFSDCGRVINGSIMMKLYRPLSDTKGDVK